VIQHHSHVQHPVMARMMQDSTHRGSIPMMQQPFRNHDHRQLKQAPNPGAEPGQSPPVDEQPCTGARDFTLFGNR
jgi:hypothetical protein